MPSTTVNITLDNLLRRLGIVKNWDTTKGMTLTMRESANNCPRKRRIKRKFNRQNRNWKETRQKRKARENAWAKAEANRRKVEFAKRLRKNARKARLREIFGW